MDSGAEVSLQQRFPCAFRQILTKSRNYVSLIQRSQDA